MTDSVYEIEGTWEEILARAPELRGARVRLTVVSPGPAPTASVPSDDRVLSASQLRLLPLAERAAYLQEAAATAAPLYDADLARPPRERELTAFTALDGEEFDEDGPA